MHITKKTLCLLKGHEIRSFPPAHSNEYYSRRVTDTFAGQYLYLLFHSCFPDVVFLQNTIKCIFWDFDKVKNFISVLALHLNSRLSLCDRETVMENWPSPLQPI